MLENMIIALVLTGMVLSVLSLMIYSLWLIWIGFLSRWWPSVQGQLITAQAELVVRENGIYQTDTAHAEAGLKYRYSVDGVEYVSKRRTLGEYSIRGMSEAQRIVSKYQAIQAMHDGITVYYSPWNPGFSVLEPGFEWKMIAGPYIGSMLLMFLILMVHAFFPNPITDEIFTRYISLEQALLLILMFYTSMASVFNPLFWKTFRWWPLILCVLALAMLFGLGYGWDDLACWWGVLVDYFWKIWSYRSPA